MCVKITKISFVEILMKNYSNSKTTIATKRNNKLLSDALFALMCKRSFSTISVVDICETAMVPRATFYNYFEDKYDLFRYSFKSKFDIFYSALGTFTPGTEKYLTNFLSVTIDYLTSHKDILTKIMLADDNVGTMEVQKLISSKMLEAFTAAQAKLDFIVPIEPLSEFYSGALIFTIKWWLSNDPNVTKDKLIEYVSIMINPNRFIREKK